MGVLLQVLDRVGQGGAWIGPSLGIAAVQALWGRGGVKAAVYEVCCVGGGGAGDDQDSRAVAGERGRRARHEGNTVLWRVGSMRRGRCDGWAAGTSMTDSRGHRGARGRERRALAARLLDGHVQHVHGGRGGHDGKQTGRRRPETARDARSCCL